MKLQKILFYAVCTVFLSGVFALGTRAEILYGIGTTSSAANAPVTGLVTINTATPNTVTPVAAFTGVAAGQIVQSIDFRPSNGALYAVSITPGGTAGTLYTVNLATAALTTVGTFNLAAPAVPTGYNPATTNIVEIEFNPVTDQIRLITGANLDGNFNPVPNNYRLDPATGAITVTDTHFDYVAGDANAGNVGYILVASAYANPAAGKTTLYSFDRSTDSIVRIGAVGGTTPNTPESGRLFTIQKPPFTYTTGSGIGMDVGPSGTLYITRDGQLFSVNANTGAQTLLGTYPAGTFVSDISVQRTTTAAGVTVSGRLLINDSGRGLVGATVVLTNSMGRSVTAVTTKGGNFTIMDVPSGETYILNVKSRLYRFEARTIQVFDSVADITMTGESVGATSDK